MAKRRSARARKSPTPKAARQPVGPVGPAPTPLGPLVTVASAIGAAAATAAIKAMATAVASGDLAPTVVRVPGRSRPLVACWRRLVVVVVLRSRHRSVIKYS